MTQGETAVLIVQAVERVAAEETTRSYRAWFVGFVIGLGSGFVVGMVMAWTA